MSPAMRDPVACAADYTGARLDQEFQAGGLCLHFLTLTCSLTTPNYSHDQLAG
jgi:hypothetical protein